MSLSEEDFKQWKKKRQSTFISYLLYYFCQGLAQSMIAASLDDFLKEEIVFDNKDLLYSTICGVYNANSIIFYVLISKWSDKSRNTKELLFICTFLNLLGIVLYTFTFSPYLMVLGRFLQGSVHLPRPSTTAEIARSYPVEELHRKLPLVTVFKMVGFAVGPIISVFFVNQHITIGTLYLRYGSICGFFLTVLALIQLVIITLFTSNLSKEYDLKANSIGNGNESDVDIDCIDDNNDYVDGGESGNVFYAKVNVYVDDDNENSDGTQPLKSEDSANNYSLVNIIGKLISNQDTCLLLLATFFNFFVTNIFFWSIPKLISDFMHSSPSIISYYYTAHFDLILIMITVIIRISMTDLILFWFGASNFISIILATVFMLLIYRERNFTAQLVLLGLFCFCFAYQELGEKIFVTVSFVKMLRSQNQGTCEGIRQFLLRIGGMLGSTLAIYVLKYYDYSFWFVISIMTFLLIWLVSRKRSFLQPRMVV